jgi:hypothetical protein
MVQHSPFVLYDEVVQEVGDVMAFESRQASLTFSDGCCADSRWNSIWKVHSVLPGANATQLQQLVPDWSNSKTVLKRFGDRR